MTALSVIIPTYNSARYLGRALESLALQDYPQDDMEVLIADGGSQDSTREIVRRYENRLSLHLVDNAKRREAEYGKALALDRASGQLVQFIDSDMWASSPTLLSDLVRPLVEDDTLAGSITVYKNSRELNVWNRFLSCDELQRDPLFEVLTPDLDDFVTFHRNGMEICEFPTERIPPIGGTTMFRRSEIDVALWGGHFRELDHPVALVVKGRQRFALIRREGWVHQHCRGLRDLVRKRIRNLAGLDTSFLALGDQRDFVWLDTSNKGEVLRLIKWVIGTNLILPRILEGTLQAWRMRRPEPFLRPIVAITITDALLLTLLRSGAGRDLIKRGLLVGR